MFNIMPMFECLKTIERRNFKFDNRPHQVGNKKLYFLTTKLQLVVISGSHLLLLGRGGVADYVTISQAIFSSCSGEVDSQGTCVDWVSSKIAGNWKRHPHTHPFHFPYLGNGKADASVTLLEEGGEVETWRQNSWWDLRRDWAKLIPDFGNCSINLVWHIILQFKLFIMLRLNCNARNLSMEVIQ